ncbi:MAG: sugar phosphate isomerase/epimerase [Clostridia bacterium]|nr:sugar phosphate isomerase/epimerase [Clostridia bacterium]
MLNIGLSSCGKPLCAELFESYSRAGITHIEISENKSNTAKLQLNELAEWSRRFGVTLWSLHLPFMPFAEIDISAPTLSELSVEYYYGLIKKGTEIGIRNFIVHPSGEPIADEERKERMAYAKSGLKKLAELSLPLGATVCVENLPRTCLGRDSSDMLELLSAHPALRSCFDTNHLLGEDPAEYIKKVGSRIVTLHVSDYDFLNERHWLPGEGQTDFAAILSALSDFDYCGPWLYELGFDTPTTVSRSRDLTCEDFVRNANELFLGKALTVIGTPKPGLTSWKKKQILDKTDK